MHLLVATRNRGKLQEIQEIFKLPGLELLALDDVGPVPEVEEDGDTFVANASKKARQTALATGLWTLADDSGLAVDALNGAPGVYSARYAGEYADDQANNAKLLHALHGVKNRQACFHCVIALSDPTGNVETVTGTCHGHVTTAARGQGGFGYDPLFIPAGKSQTYAELSAEEKHTVSHRGQALQAAARTWRARLVAARAHPGDRPRHVKRAMNAVVAGLVFGVGCAAAVAGPTGRQDRVQIQLRDVTVRAAPLAADVRQMGRRLDVLDSRTMESAHSGSIAELLETGTALMVSERGAGSVQADLSLRGSTFQQVMVTMDGLPLVDAQTAHHNMNLPFPAAALEQITVIPGPGSAWFGPAAFAGVVEFTPREPVASGATAEAAWGSFDTLRTGATVEGVGAEHKLTGAFAHERSGGFQDGTDYDVWSVWGSGVRLLERGRVRLSLGHTEKDFGAQDFYASFPSRERIRLTLLDLASGVQIAPEWEVKFAVRYRRHEDEFILIEENPDVYRNEHVTETWTERLTVTAPETVFGRTAAGFERSDWVLDSSNLGDRREAGTAAFLQHRLTGAAGALDVGLRLDCHSQWRTEVSPSLAVTLPLLDTLMWRASVARGIRPPSFTERYYTDPVNTGNPELNPEVAWGGETGLDVSLPYGMTAAVTYFERNTAALIDWVRSDPDEAWQAVNIGRAHFRGGEAHLAGAWNGVWLDAAYRYTGVNVDSDGLESKYALNVARHEVKVSLGIPLVYGVHAVVGGMYRHVPSLDSYQLLHARLSKRLGSVVIFARGRNILDEDYQTIPGVPSAGRYLEAGVAVDLL